MSIRYHLDMLTQTSELACKTLLFLGFETGRQPLSPRQIAEALDCSPSYLAKTVGMLVRAGLLRSIKGAHGGVLLARKPEEITLLAIIEACQGLLIANFCREIELHQEALCAFHQAMKELHSVTVKTLSKWTLKHLLEGPVPANLDPAVGPPCKMAFKGCERLFPSEKGSLKPEP